MWGSREGRLDKPDRLVFDLDRSGRDFAVVRATARAVADLGLVCFVKTTGSRGLHVVAPLSGDADFDTARQFARDVAAVVADDDPAHRTIEIRKANRGPRVYLDVMRNAYGQTAAAPYAVRARPGAPVAPRWTGTNSTYQACGQTNSRSATCPGGWPATATRGGTSTGTSARFPSRYSACHDGRASLGARPNDAQN